MYVAADNNLEMYWDGASLEMMLEIPGSESVCFVAFVDRLSTDGIELVEVSEGTTQVVGEYEEMNTGDGETFSFFLEEVADAYPADHTVIVVWDHGSAWKGCCVDDTSGGDRISLLEMGEGIEDAGTYIDILAFDACACSSIELTYQVAMTGLVGKIVASEELVAGDGFPYDLMFSPLALDSDRTVEQVTQDMLDGWVECYSVITWAWYCPMTIVDVPSVLAAKEAI
ncbi:MAG: clostripain-related cysteine peptidase, partial [Thermoplasmata archaeon]|nr:clostripain-related cysteine peptidase [Thermoplasmata archaeon]